MSIPDKPTRPFQRLTPEQRLDLAERLRWRALQQEGLTPEQRREAHRRAGNLEKLVILDVARIVRARG